MSQQDVIEQIARAAIHAAIVAATAGATPGTPDADDLILFIRKTPAISRVVRGTAEGAGDFITVTGAGTPDVNGIYTRRMSGFLRPAYNLTGQISTIDDNVCKVDIESDWLFSVAGHNRYVSSNGNPATPDLAVWTTDPIHSVIPDGSLPVPTVVLGSGTVLTIGGLTATIGTGGDIDPGTTNLEFVANIVAYLKANFGDIGNVGSTGDIVDNEDGTFDVTFEPGTAGNAVVFSTDNPSLSLAQQTAGGAEGENVLFSTTREAFGLPVPLIVEPILFADLPTPASFGMIVAVSDASSTVPGDVFIGEGSLHILAYNDGTDWRVLGGTK